MRLSLSLLYFVALIMPSGGAFATPNSKSESATAAASAAASDATEGDGNQKASEVPLLPEPDKDSQLPSIKLGETISFEEMGPVIINSDGTTRRIGNWDELSEHEKKVTWRRISKRNEERRKALLEQQQMQQEQDAAEDTAESE